MPKGAGRAAVISKNAVPIAGIRSASISLGAEFIDVTDKDSAGVVTLLSGVVKTQQLTVQIEGLTDSAVLQDIAYDPTASKFLTDLTIQLPVVSGVGKDTLGGTFVMTAFESGLPHDDAMTFSATFVSSGAWTFA